MGRTRILRIETSDGQVHVFEGSKDEISTVRERLLRVRDGSDPHVDLVNRQGRRVRVHAGRIEGL